MPSEVINLVKNHKDAYMNFLRQEEKAETTFAEENIRTYNEKFHPVIAQLKEKIGSGDGKMLPEYLGSGARGSAFRIEVDGKVYAAKFSSHVTQANFELKPLIRAKGIPHVAQLASYSFGDQVVVMELLPGKDVTTFTPEEAPQYSDEHIIQLVETVKELDGHGIMIDPKASNFMYDPKEGFSILDFHLNDSGGRYSVAQQVVDLRNALCARKYEQLDYGTPDYQDKAEAQNVVKYSISLPMMVRFLTLLQQNYPDVITNWKQQHEELKRQPRTSVGELIPRDYIPKRPEFEPYLKQLQSLGF